MHGGQLDLKTLNQKYGRRGNLYDNECLYGKKQSPSVAVLEPKMKETYSDIKCL
jgi:hypothetical protein